MVLHEILAPGLQEQFFEGATKRIRRNFILLKDTRYLDNTNLISQKKWCSKLWRRSAYNVYLYDFDKYQGKEKAPIPLQPMVVMRQ